MISEDPSDPFLFYALALEYEKEGEGKKCKEILLEVREKFPEYDGVSYKLGQIFESEGDIEEALDEYDRGKRIAENGGNQKALREFSEAILRLEE